MKVKRLLLIWIASLSFFGSSQSDGCSGTVPTLTVGTTCSPTNYSILSSFVDDFATEPSCGTDYKDGFFKFTATSTATTITMTDATTGNPNPGFMLLTGTCGGGFTEIACEETGNVTETLNITTVVGQVYYIVIFRANNVGTNNMDGTICVTEYNSTVVSASDCNIAVPVCTNIGFQIDPNGSGSINDIPTLGSYGNPEYDGFWGPYNPWGTYNDGCLQAGETNSTWMVVNITTGGSLEFSFGGGGTQAGYYDWIMYPFSGASTCNNIRNNLVAPVRCNWNYADYGGTGLASTTPSGGSSGNYEPPLTVASNSQYIICFSNWSSSTTNVPLQFGGTAVVSCSPLGVDLISFYANANCDDDVVTVEWETKNELNHAYFEVQRSIDGITWEILGKVEEPNEIINNSNFYTFRSPIASQAIVYYRLKNVDFDGKYTYSDIKGTNCIHTLKLNTLVPNPSSEITNLLYKSSSDGSLIIVDAFGRVIQSMILENTDKSIIQKPINVSDLAAGWYQFITVIDGETITIKFIKN